MRAASVADRLYLERLRMESTGSGAVVVRASCDVAGVDPRLGADELAPLLLRSRGFNRAVAARMAAKEAVREALAAAGMAAALVPPSCSLVVRRDSRGRPYVEPPDSAARWLNARGFTVDASLAHEGSRGAAAAVVATVIPTAHFCLRCGGTLR